MSYIASQILLMWVSRARSAILFAGLKIPQWRRVGNNREIGIEEPATFKPSKWFLPVYPVSTRQNKQGTWWSGGVFAFTKLLAFLDSANPTIPRILFGKLSHLSPNVIDNDWHGLWLQPFWPFSPAAWDFIGRQWRWIEDRRRSCSFGNVPFLSQLRHISVAEKTPGLSGFMAWKNSCNLDQPAANFGSFIMVI